MRVERIRPGLYVRTDTPRNVRITPEFAEAIGRYSESAAVIAFIDQVVRAQEAERLSAESSPTH